MASAADDVTETGAGVRRGFDEVDTGAVDAVAVVVGGGGGDAAAVEGAAAGAGLDPPRRQSWGSTCASASGTSPRSPGGRFNGLKIFTAVQA